VKTRTQGRRAKWKWCLPAGLVLPVSLQGASFLLLPALPDIARSVTVPNALEQGSSVEDVSDDGSTVVGTYHVGPHKVPFRWTKADGMSIVGDLSEKSASASAVSADGRIVAGTGDLGRTVQYKRNEQSYPAPDPVRWSDGDSMIRLGLLERPGSGYGAVDMSADGSAIIGQGSRDRRGGRSNNVAFVWTEVGGMREFPENRKGRIGGTRERFRNDALLEAHGISADGTTIVGSYIVGTGFRLVWLGFVWTEGTGFESVGGLREKKWPLSSATDVSADGSVVVGTVFKQKGGGLFGSPKQTGCAYRWERSTGMRALDVLSGAPMDRGKPVSNAVAISADGRFAVGTCLTQDGDPVVVIWQESGAVRRLDQLLAAAGVPIEGFNLNRVSAISGDGRIVVGSGYSSGGWVADLSGTTLFPE